MLNDAKMLLEVLESTKEKLGIKNSNNYLNENSNPCTSGIFSHLEIRKHTLTSNISSSDSSQHPSSKNMPHIVSKPINKNKKYYFRISFLKNSIQFLDLKTILNLSLVNKEFSYFIKSVYFYKFMQNMVNKKKAKTFKSQSSKIVENKKPVKTAGNSYYSSGILGNFVGALGSVLGISNSNTPNSSSNVIDPKICEEKIKIYEKILNTKFKNQTILREIKDIKDQVDSMIMSKQIEKKESYSNFILKDEEIEKIKREKIEQEYFALISEIKNLKEESEKYNSEIETLQREEIEKEKILSSLNMYVNNNLKMKIEDIKITSKENMKSGKYGELETDVSSLALLNSYMCINDN